MIATLIDYLRMTRNGIDPWAIWRAEQQLEHLGARASRDELIKLYHATGQLRSLVQFVSESRIQGDLNAEHFGRAIMIGPDESRNPRPVAPAAMAIAQCLGLLVPSTVAVAFVWLQDAMGAKLIAASDIRWDYVLGGALALCAVIALHAFVAARVGVHTSRLIVFGPAALLAAIGVGWMVKRLVN